MNLVFSPQAWEDYQHWQQTDQRILKRINSLIKESMCVPHEGIGKPEPLRHTLAGLWSRRITDEHRMVYRIADQNLEIAQLRFHYSK
jgi:toxin YoeB